MNSPPILLLGNCILLRIIACDVRIKVMKKILLLILLIIFIPLLSSAYSFSKSLSLGSTGEEVRQLQIFLNNYVAATQVAATGPGSPGNETAYFGNLTKNAVRKFQDINFSAILEPLNLVSGTGYFGPSTINFINSLGFLETANPETEVEEIESIEPFIESISPTSGTAGTKITIEGKNFTDKNDIIVTFEALDRFEKIKSKENGTKIEFEIESSAQEALDKQLKSLSSSARAKVLPKIANGELAISVTNENGTSNFKIFNLVFK
jgi:peptidoglycan hydrolase-like protein with peptidoglycan-binding domain